MGITVILILILIFLNKIHKRNKKSRNLNKKYEQKEIKKINEKTESKNEELAKILYYLEHLNAFTETERENILKNVDDLVAKNRIYLSEDFSKNWVNLKHHLFVPEATKLREKLQNQLKQKLEN